MNNDSTYQYMCGNNVYYLNIGFYAMNRSSSIQKLLCKASRLYYVKQNVRMRIME